MSLFHALATYLRIRAFPIFVRDRAALHAWQAKRLRRWMQRDVPKVAAFAHLTNPRLTDLPMMAKSDLMADFARYNTAGITNAEGWAAFEGSRRKGTLTIGASTGTSGNRGLFVISDAERFSWLGAMLAKALPDFWRHRDRVAVMLPINTPLYDSANRFRRLKLAFFDLGTPFELLVEQVTAFDPTVIVAPPRILHRLGLAATELRPRKVFSAAEKLDATDQTAIEARFGPLHEIYMATEGLFGVTCRKGRLHLSEDCLHFEFLPAGDGLVMPVISDFSRRCQIMARYRMNDLMRLDPEPCPCGSPLMAVQEIVGREDDVFLLPGMAGATIELTPDILRNAVLDSDRNLDDFRLVQTDAARLVLSLAKGVDPAPARAALTALLERHGCEGVSIDYAVFGSDPPGKLRRVRRDWGPK